MATKRVLTSALVPGMKLASDVITSIGQILLVKGSILKDEDITRLDFYSVLSVNIEIEPEKPKRGDTAEGERTSYLEQIKKKPEFQEYKMTFARDNREFETVCHDVAEKGGVFDVDRMVELVEELATSAKKVCGIFDMLHSLRSYDDEVYAHGINVALICCSMADWYGLNENDRRTLILSGLIHDIGKTKVDKNILHKAGELTEEELRFIMNHAVEGYNIVANHKNLNEHIKNAVLLHHERCDGSGYPLKLSGDRTDDFAKMVAIADVYEAVTSPRVYRPALCPFFAIKLFEEEGMRKYDPKYLLPFLENVLNTYLQNKVRLSNGEEGMVVMINKNALSKPLVRTKDAVYDLRKHPELEILEVC